MVMRPIFYFLFFSLLLACGGTRHIAHAEATEAVVSTTPSESSDPGIAALIAPYKAKLDSQMNQVVAMVGIELVKAKPEGTLGNWTADAIFDWTQRHGYTPDMAMMNHGGLRLPAIQPGPLTVGELYELSPFDNQLVVVEVPGEKMDSLMRHVASTGGWPVSANVRMVISQEKLAGFSLGGSPLDNEKVYRIAMPDYIANGGDGTKMLIGLRQTDTGLLVRDALLEEARMTGDTGTPITARLEGRTIVRFP